MHNFIFLKNDTKRVMVVISSLLSDAESSTLQLLGLQSHYISFIALSHLLHFSSPLLFQTLFYLITLILAFSIPT